MVTAAAGALKVTVPGPLTWLQLLVNELFGNPSSVTLPFKVALPGSVTVEKVY